MSGRRKRTVGLVRVVCTAPYHRDTEEFARRGFHFICPMELVPVHTNARESRPFTLYQMGVARDRISPVKGALHEHGEHVYKFKCSCPLDVQRSEFELVDLVMARFRAVCAADPRATRIDLDITTI